MPKPYSLDLREYAAGFVDAGPSRRAPTKPAPTLNTGDVAIMDNVGYHMHRAIRCMARTIRSQAVLSTARAMSPPKPAGKIARADLDEIFFTFHR